MFRFVFLLLVLGVGSLEGWLFYSGDRLTVWAERASVGEQVEALGYHPAEYDMLICHQFNGRRLVAALYRHDADGLNGGYASCPRRVDEAGSPLWPSGQAVSRPKRGED